MRFATFRKAGAVHVGMVDGDTVRSLAELDAARPVTTMTDVIDRFGELYDRLNDWPHARRDGVRGAEPYPLDDVELLAPLPAPHRNLLCVGKNYASHAREFDRSGYSATPSGGVPGAPIVFTKPPESVIGPYAPIRLPRGVTGCLDYGAELAVVIGRRGRGIRAQDAHRHIFGYTILNDVTARDLQLRHGQWFLGKALDDSSPMGPWIVTADETDGTAALGVRCWVNGELRQQADTGELVFGIPDLIATLSAGMTLYPGDVIATGTPAGVGAGFDPPRFLAAGDTVRVEISGIGTLTNPVAEVAAGAATEGADV
ncbi:FAA hydrolase family protein [Streptomyces armeniacus]|uniref:FAA hydrolase family protein n=1 Tax=Streptomyces armeniacus TaxID=83291 RepID=A0A345XK87_9ACTN|nr:fumarylacetoacetate hydrolase family protein [Streptomyces armeniacus]AXK32053.1 FAA hydrolase family protein [Streptomyces armeniacus]